MNMLKAIKISNAGSFQHYIYDANGERTLKGIGQYGLMDLNGLSQTVSTIGNYSQYVSGYMVMGPHYMVTNHYYSGTERIACKLVGSVDSSVDNSLELSGSEKAGLPDRQAEDLELVRTEFGFDTLIIDDVDPDEDDCEGNNDCPNVLYFFHPDHIGSSTFLTDEAGNPYQFILYLPFGEGMAEQKAGGYSTKYRFTGKELDEETGLYYFGARYYDPRISLWFGVDPMAEKYLNFSPYTYVANNPLAFVDPNGKELEIKEKHNDETNSAKRTFDQLQSLTSQKLKMAKDGKITIIAGIGNNEATEEGTKLVADLIGDKKMITITNDVSGTNRKESQLKDNAFTIANDKANASNGKGTGSKILFSPDIKAEFENSNCGREKAPVNRVLAHELIHADNNRTGTRETYAYPIGNAFQSNREEQKTFSRENLLFKIQRYDGTNYKR